MEIQKRYAARLASLVGILSVLSISVYAQASNTITGFIFSSERSPVEGISVELQDEFYHTLGRMRTDRSGRYVFSRLRQGRYFIKVLPLGTSYEEQTGELEIVNIIQQSTETFQKDFYLRDKKSVRPTQTMVGVVFAQEIPPAAKKHYDTAIERLNDDKKQSEGVDELLKAVDAFPTYYVALEKLAQQYIKLSNYDRAITVAAKAVEINPKGYESWYALGYSYFQLKRSQEAVFALKTAVDLNSASVNTLFLLGVSLRQIEKYTEAEESLLKAKKLAPAPIPEIHWQLALLYTNNLKKYSAAVKELELFLKANPKYQEAEKVRDLIKKLKIKDRAAA